MEVINFPGLADCRPGVTGHMAKSAPELSDSTHSHTAIYIWSQDNLLCLLSALWTEPSLAPGLPFDANTTKMEPFHTLITAHHSPTGNLATRAVLKTKYKYNGQSGK